MSENFLTRDQQVAAKIEAVSGVAETLTSSEVKLKPFQGDTPYAPDYPRFSNDEVSEDIGEAADFVGGKKGTIQASFNLKTSGTVGTVPAIDVFLQACGLKQQIVHQITVDAPAGGDGKFEAGATYSATGGKTGIVEAERNGAGTLRYIITAGGALAATDDVTVGTDEATCSGTDTLHSVKYTPLSTNHKTITLQRGEKNEKGTANKDNLVRIRGAFGTGRIELPALDAGKFHGDFQGVEDFEGDGALFSGYTYEPGDAPKFNNATVELNGVPIKVSELGFDFGTAVEMEPDPTTSGGTAGFDYAKAGRRTPVITVNPFKMNASDLDDLGLLGSGALVPFQLIYGTSPQMIEISSATCQIRGWTEADRVGRRVVQLSLNVVRGTIVDNDYAIYFR